MLDYTMVGSLQLECGLLDLARTVMRRMSAILLKNAGSRHLSLLLNSKSRKAGGVIVEGWRGFCGNEKGRKFGPCHVASLAQADGYTTHSVYV